MANETTSSRVIQLSQLFSAPLVAVIEADFLAAQRFAAYIEQFGFIKDAVQSGEDGHYGTVRTVRFAHPRQNGNGTSGIATTEIPLLSMLPLPLLQVRDAEFSFDVRLLDFDTGESAGPPSLRAQSAQEKAAVPTSPAPLTSRALLAPSGAAGEGGAGNTNSANMNVKLRMQQADIPAGVSALLNAMNESISTSTTSEGTTDNATSQS
jgi:hypothetical protein